MKNCHGTLQIYEENVLKVVTAFLYTYPEREGDVSTNTIEAFFVTHKALQIEDVKYVRI